MQINREWINISDMMAGLMMVFLFIAVLYMSKITELVEKYNDVQNQINAALKIEFKDDLEKWDVKILDNNTIRFNSPDIQFDSQQITIKPKFKELLNDFFPRYLDVLITKEFKDEIQEVRVEGHTSSLWVGSATHEEAYLKNMQLSQDRATSVLEYSYRIKSISERDWLEQVFRANGLSSSQLIIQLDESEDTKASQRVDFRVLTKADETIKEIINALPTSN